MKLKKLSFSIKTELLKHIRRNSKNIAYLNIHTNNFHLRDSHAFGKISKI
jgi:hypothetical protein